VTSSAGGIVPARSSHTRRRKAASLVRVQPQMNERDELFVTFDGQAGHQLEAGDEVRIRCAERRVRLLRPSTRSYFDILRQKLKWNER